MPFPVEKCKYYLAPRLGSFESQILSIGLILCRSKSKLIAEYALRGFKKPIGVAGLETQIVNKLPDDLKSSLPTAEEMKAELALKDERQ
jgi:hypothetical protein